MSSPSSNACLRACCLQVLLSPPSVDANDTISPASVTFAASWHPLHMNSKEPSAPRVQWSNNQLTHTVTPQWGHPRLEQRGEHSPWISTPCSPRVTLSIVLRTNQGVLTSCACFAARTDTNAVSSPESLRPTDNQGPASGSGSQRRYRCP